MKNKKAQEEMVGFAVILVIIFVIFLIILSFSLRNSKETSVESYEVESFIGSCLQFTTDCEDYYDFMDIQGLIMACSKEQTCVNDNRNSCDVLNSTIKDILSSSWNIQEGSPIKGYKFYIKNEQKTILSIFEGNETVNSKGNLQDFAGKGEKYQFSLTIFS